MASAKTNAPGAADHVAETGDAEGENVKLSRFGGFFVADQALRVGCNPQTGEEMEISARRVVRFNASPVPKGEVDDLDVLPGRCWPLVTARSWGGRL